MIKPVVRRALWPHAMAWVLASILGWLGYRFATRSFQQGEIRDIEWAAALGAIVVTALCLNALLHRVAVLDEGGRRALMMLVGWAVGAATGWYYFVVAGGPLVGLVMAVVLLAPSPLRWIRLALVIAAGLLAVRVGLSLTWFDPLIQMACWTTGLTIAALAVASYTTAGGLPLLRSAGLVAWWAIAWVGSYWLSNRLGLPEGYTTTSVEVILAFTLGGLATPCEAPVMRRCMAWMTGGAIAVSVGIIIEQMLLFVAGSVPNSVLPASSLYLDVGHVIGMPLGALVAITLIDHRRRSAGLESTAR